jgi:hypothetical protein
MKKLRLNLDQLAVETFDVTFTAAQTGGTVRGHVSWPAPATCVNTDCEQNTCAETCRTCPDTCFYSCGGTCENSCEGSCVATCGPCDSDGVQTCYSCEGTCPPACTVGLAPC